MAIPFTGKTFRDHWLDSLSFQHQPDSWNYLELHHYEGASTFIREGPLKDFELSDWLNARGLFKLPVQDGAKPHGTQRLLYIHRPPDRQAAKRCEPTIPCTKSMFIEITETLKLPAGWCHDASSKNACMVKIPRTFWPDDLTFAFYRYTARGDFALASTTDLKNGITTGVAYGNDVNHCDIPILEEMITLLKLQALNYPLIFAFHLLHRMLYHAEGFLLDVRYTLDTIAAGLQLADHEMTPFLVDTYQAGNLDRRHTLENISAGSHFVTHEMTQQLKERFRKENMLSRNAALSLMNRKIVSSTYYLTYNVFRHSELLLNSINESSIAAKDLFTMLQNTFTQLKLDRENMNTRLQTLATTLHNRIAQEDNSLSYSQAADMRRIAAASRRDSSAMKTIALLTSVFLPGTFVAAIFGMNLFEFSSQERTLVVSKSFWLYWAITVPLTLFVMVILIIWFHWSQKMEDQRKDEEEAPFGKEKVL
ncbi:hypothetical protein GJ744_012278 [Endocarpon pusillum]|uniref:Uncharacterized protein n=1 Tax=Endocarpon pusillum TaxID=364733 RepID=A0A8H7AF89_9EURO|nr:hypothetical protein GJ744_012278 [Endocarpon pusillum]